VFEPMRRRLPVTSLAAAATFAAVLFPVVLSCVTVPPPDVAATPLHPPIIEHDAVLPPEGETLSTWPKTLWIPIELFDSDESFEYAVFVDYTTATTAPDIGPVLVRPPPPEIDGGIYLLEVETPGVPLDGLCHKLEVVVAHSFSTVSVHSPDSVGGDSVWWWYGPDGCPTVWQQDGAFPADAPYEGVQLVPDSGGTE
jgi:hypothetical protein